jgi:hypothetical protein
VRIADDVVLENVREAAWTVYPSSMWSRRTARVDGEVDDGGFELDAIDLRNPQAGPAEGADLLCSATEMTFLFTLTAAPIEAVSMKLLTGLSRALRSWRSHSSSLRAILHSCTVGAA